MDTFLFEMSMKWMFTFKNFRNVYWHGMTHSAMVTITTKMAMKTILTMMSIVFVRKLEVVHKEVGGYLTRCVLPRRSLWMMNHQSLSHSVSHSLTRVGIELLGQQKMTLSHNCLIQVFHTQNVQNHRAFLKISTCFFSKTKLKRLHGREKQQRHCTKTLLVWCKSQIYRFK